MKWNKTLFDSTPYLSLSLFIFKVTWHYYKITTCEKGFDKNYSILKTARLHHNLNNSRDRKLAINV